MKVYLKNISVILIFVLAVLVPKGSKSNAASLTRGNLGNGHVKLLNNRDISIENEILSINLHKHFAKIKVKYIFQNTGKSQTAKMGFPSLIFGKKDEISKYKISVGGKKIKYKYYKGNFVRWKKMSSMYDGSSKEDRPPDSEIYANMGWYISKVKFDENEKKIITISYISSYEAYEDSVSGVVNGYGSEKFTYFLSTGASWKGSIKKGKIILRFHGIDVKTIKFNQLKKYKKYGNTLIRSFHNFEPSAKDNIVIDFQNGFSTYTPIAEKKFMSWTVLDGDNYYFDHNDFYTSSSSTHKPRLKYHDIKVCDGEKETSWVEGKKGSGIGEYIIIETRVNEKLNAIGIMNGYNKNAYLYFANNRIAALKIYINGKYFKRAKLQDYFSTQSDMNPRAFQYIDLSSYKEKIKKIKLVIDKVYKGSKFDDTCISEIVLRKKLKKKPEIRCR